MTYVSRMYFRNEATVGTYNRVDATPRLAKVDEGHKVTTTTGGAKINELHKACAAPREGDMTL